MTETSMRAEIRRLEKRTTSPWLALGAVAAVDVLSALLFLASLD